MPGPPLVRLLSRSVLLWVGVIFFAVGMVFVSLGMQEWRTQQRFDRESLQVDAAVLDVSIQRATRDGNARTKYLVTYRFTSADEQTIEQTGEVPVDEWERLKKGDSLSIRYAPSDPTIARTGSPDQWWAPLAFVAFGGLFVLIGVVVGRSELRRVFVLWRVWRHGVAVNGVVIRVWATGTTINRVRLWQLSYTFHDHEGRTQQGTSDLLAPDEAASWTPGDTGTVRFDRLRPHENVWIGRVE